MLALAVEEVYLGEAIDLERDQGRKAGGAKAGSAKSKAKAKAKAKPQAKTKTKAQARSRTKVTVRAKARVGVKSVSKVKRAKDAAPKRTSGKARGKAASARRRSPSRKK